MSGGSIVTIETTGTIPKRLGRWYRRESAYTLIFPPGLDPPPHLVQAIRVFEDNYVPVGLIESWRTPGNSDVEFFFHVIGKWAQTPDEPDDAEFPPEIVHAPRPSDFHFKGGVIYAVRPWTQPQPPYLAQLGAPEQFLPFDKRLVDWMDATHREYVREFGDTKKKILAQMERAKDNERKQLDSIEEEGRLRLIDNKNQMGRALGISETVALSGGTDAAPTAEVTS